MAAGDTLQGQRMPKGSDPYHWPPGAYGRFVNGTQGEVWYAKTPNGHQGNLALHDVTEHDDGTITVNPSILVSTRRKGVDVELWHGYLKAGVWEPC